MKVGVTGGAGFIASHVIDQLIGAGHEPVIFDHAGRRGHRDDVEWMLGDVRDEVAVTELAAHVDGIIHLAACLGTQETIKNPRPAAETNLFGSLHVFNAVRQYDLPAVYIGVGNHWMNNSYSITKTAAERFAAMYNRESGARINVVRVVNAYGPRQSVAPPYGPAKVRKITPAFVCRALTGSPIEVYGDGHQISDMVHVADAARTLVAAFNAAADGTVLDQVVECGPVDHQSVNDVAQAVIAAVVDRGGKPVDVVHLPMRPGEIPGARVTADASTLELVGVDPATLIPLGQGIAETVHWFAEHWLATWLGAHTQWCVDERGGDCGWCSSTCVKQMATAGV